ncbi:helix-turn-helix transcriptional regulator [Sphingomonas aerolata]|uniref:helix-turn-helix transcriptional regulator n=1 Tax=Sphingomonas aerolata TaxID=185951 RepID=UPI0033448DF9
MFESIISVEEVVKMTGLSRTTIWRKRRKGTFPCSVQISEGRVGFRISDLDAWMAGLGVAV